MAASTPFRVRRSNPEAIVPSKPTPSHALNLSDLDHEGSVRNFVSTLQFYHHSPSMADIDPVWTIKDALARTLVFYYPLAGRLRQSAADRRKMVVDCSGEGAVFVEADADVSIDCLGNPLRPPFPYLREFVDETPEGFAGDVLNCPLVHVQVTRMKCGGFVVGMRMSHNMMDGMGAVQFINALTEIARGAAAPSAPPVWQRELISARSPPTVTCVHHEFDDDDHHHPATIPNMAYRLLFFTQVEISALRSLVPDHLNRSSSFDLIAACLWRTRALALHLRPEEKARLAFAVNARQKYEPPLPKGYYGNAIASVGVMCTVQELRRNSFGYALEKVVKAKESVTDEYMRSFVDELVLRGYPEIALTMPSYFITDLRRLGLHEVDFGWGKPVYGGPALAWYQPFPHMESSFILSKNSAGEEGTLVAVCLPAPNINFFIEELCKLVEIQAVDPCAKATVN